MEIAELNIPKIQQKAQDGQEELTVGVFNGRLNLSIFSGTGKPPVWRQGLNADACTLFESVIKQVLSGQPGVKIPLIFQKYDKQTNKFNIDSTLVVGKDEKQLCYFEVQFTANNAPRTIRFIMKSSSGVSTGDSFNAVSSSANRMKTILTYCERILPVVGFFTDKKQDFSANKGGGAPRGNGSGGGYNRPPAGATGGGQQRSFGQDDSSSGEQF